MSAPVALDAFGSEFRFLFVLFLLASKTTRTSAPGVITSGAWSFSKAFPQSLWSPEFTSHLVFFLWTEVDSFFAEILSAVARLCAIRPLIDYFFSQNFSFDWIVCFRDCLWFRRRSRGGLWFRFLRSQLSFEPGSRVFMFGLFGRG